MHAGGAEPREAVDDPKPYRATSEGLLVCVRLTPRAARSSIDGTRRDDAGRVALAVRVAAPPVDDAANDALTAFIARELGLRASDVSIASGRKGRLKTLSLRGDAAELEARLKRRLAF